jgi:hypothetical protein
MSARAQRVAQAARLYARFSGHRAQHIDTLPLPAHDTQLLVGEAEAVAYNTVRDGKRERYVHEFRPNSRPLLTAAHDGSQLYLLDGAYRFTDRGITDRGSGGSPMSAEIAIVNPSSRKKPRTAKQKAATRRMIAARWGAKSARKSNPSSRKKHHHHGGGGFHFGRSRNPIDGAIKETTESLMPAAIGAAAGLGINALVGYLPLPATLQTGMARPLVVAAAVIAAGAGAGMMMGRKTGEMVIAGGLTVTLYDLLKGLLVTNFPNVPIAPTAVVQVPTTAAALPAPAAAVAGYVSPAMQLDDAGAYVDGMGSYFRAY